MNDSVSGSILAGSGLIGKIAVEYLTAQGTTPSKIVVGLTWLFLISGIGLMLLEYREKFT